MKYEVIWQGRYCEFDDYNEALEYAKTITFKEEKYDTALILSKNKKGVKIQGLRWIIFGMYELVNLTI